MVFSFLAACAVAADVLRHSRPGFNYILARLSGHGLEQTGVASGMSGSPVFIDGRLAGAVAFAWSFAVDPIAGITPIADMRTGMKRSMEARLSRKNLTSTQETEA